MTFINGNYKRNLNFMYLRQKNEPSNNALDKNETTPDKNGSSNGAFENDKGSTTNRGNYESLSNEMILSQMNIRVNSLKLNTISKGTDIVFSKSEIDGALNNSDLVSTYFDEIKDGENKGKYSLKDSSLKNFDKNTIISFFQTASEYANKNVNNGASNTDRANFFKAIVNKQVDLANEAKDKGANILEYVNSKLPSEITDGLNKIKSYLSQNQDWENAADTDGNNILEYNEVKSYLSEHMDWEDDIDDKNIFINQYWNQNFVSKETRAVVSTSNLEEITSAGSDIVSDVVDAGNNIAPAIAGDSVTTSFMNGIATKILNEKELATFVEEYLNTNANATQEEITAAWIKACGISVSGVLSTLATASVYAIVAKIAFNTAIDTVPTFAKESYHNLKDGFSDLFKGNIGGYFKNTFIKMPITAIRNTGRLIKNLGKNTYDVAKDIITAAGNGVYNTGKTAVTGIANSIGAVGSGFINAGKDILKGNIFGAAANVIGGVAKGAVGVVKTVGKTVGKAVGTVGKVLNNVFGNPIKSAVKLVDDVAKGATNAVKTVGKAVGSAVKSVGKAVGGAVKSVGKTIGKIFKGW